MCHIRHDGFLMNLKDVIAAALTEKYNHPYRLHIHQVAAELDINVRTLQNQLSRGLFPIPTFTISRQRYCLIVDVATHLSSLAEMGQQEHKTQRRRLGLDR